MSRVVNFLEIQQQWKVSGHLLCRHIGLRLMTTIPSQCFASNSNRVTVARNKLLTHTHTHTHPFNGPLSRTTRVSQYQKGKTNPDFTEARDSEWQWHQLGHMQVCTSLQIDNHVSTPPLRYSQAVCPTNSIKVLKAINK